MGKAGLDHQSVGLGVCASRGALPGAPVRAGACPLGPGSASNAKPFCPAGAQAAPKKRSAAAARVAPPRRRGP